MRRVLTAEQKQLGMIGRWWRFFFGFPRKRSDGEIRKGKALSKRVWGICLLIGINVMGILAESPIFMHPKTVMVLSLVGAILTTVGIVLHRVKTYGLADVFGELDD